MEKAQGGYRAIGLFFCSLLILASLSVGAMSTPAFGQMTPHNLLKVPGCGSSIVDCVDKPDSQQIPGFGQWTFSPWETVLWYWTESRNRLPKDLKTAEDQEPLKKFIEKGDRLIVGSSQTIFLSSIDAVDKKTFRDEITGWKDKLSAQKGKHPKSVGYLQDLQIALKSLIALTVSDSNRKKGL
jgi:hypothetical protein